MMGKEYDVSTEWQNKNAAFYIKREAYNFFNKENLQPIIDNLKLHIDASFLADILNQAVIIPAAAQRGYQKCSSNMTNQKKLLTVLEKKLKGIIPYIEILENYGFSTACLCSNSISSYDEANNFLEGLGKLKNELEQLKNKVAIGQRNLKKHGEKYNKKRGNTSTQATHSLIAALANIYTQSSGKKATITTNTYGDGYRLMSDGKNKPKKGEMIFDIKGSTITVKIKGADDFVIHNGDPIYSIIIAASKRVHASNTVIIFKPEETKQLSQSTLFSSRPTYSGNFFEFVISIKNIIEQNSTVSDQYGHFPKNNNTWGDMIKDVLGKLDKCRTLQK